MERIISTDNLEYQTYLGELTSLLKSKTDYEEEIKKDIIDGKLSSKLNNISFEYDNDGNITKIDKDGNITKIIKPKYIDILDKINLLEIERKTTKNLLIKMRDEILHGSKDEQITQNFYNYKDKYNEIVEEINNFKFYFNTINDTESINTELEDLEKLKDKYEEELRLIYSQMQLNTSDKDEWNRLARLYLSKEDTSYRYKLNQTNKRIIELSKIYSVSKLEDDKIKLEINTRNCNNFKILNLPEINKTISKSKKKKKQEGDVDTIFFYSRTKEYKYLSNFNVNPFKSIIYGFPEDSEVFTWPTLEHYFQASKFSTDDSKNIEYIKGILDPSNKLPAKAKAYGSNRKPKNGASIREDWDRETEELLKDTDIKLKIKDLVMREGIRLKFSQNIDLQQKLKQTYPLNLIEFSKSDKYWGSDKDKKGKNMLGKILMEYRNSLIDETQDETSSSSTRVVLKRDKKKKKETQSSNHSGGGSILKMKGTKKNNKSIQWINQDSLGNKLNDSSYDLDTNLEKIDMNSLDLNIFNDDEDNIEENINSEIISEENDIETLDLSNIKIGGNIPEIDINNLNIDITNSEGIVNENNTENMNIIDNKDNIKNIEIKDIKIGNTDLERKNNYFSDIKTDDKEEDTIQKMDSSNLNLIDLLNKSSEDNENNSSSEIKNIKIKIR
jgi:ribA/ribD-fused uncharacterized protein